METKSIAVIPARGGSKRIPRKNIKSFAGRPIISYSINSLIASNLFDEVHVSTDDEEIADVARAFGATVPFLRPSHLAGDRILTVPVIANHVQKLNLSPDSVVCCMYATAPLVYSSDLVRAYQQLTSEGFDEYVLAVSKYSYPIQRSLRKNFDYFEMVDKNNLTKFSQELEERYHDAGTFYFAYASTWLQEKLMLKHSKGIEIPSWRVQDIDTIEDWERAEIIFASIKPGH